MKRFLIALLALTFVTAEAYQIKPKDYQKTIQKPGVTVVEFWAPWCGSCAAFKPYYNRVKRALGKSVLFVELNVDGVDDVESTYGLKYGLPTLVMFKNGVEISRLPGGGDTQEVINWIKSNMR